ncbi:putative sister chromatid cohesion protein Pds5 [Helianthus annuus]|uniref:Sister chromatid cohesion protein Pds5 n=2 Tax=Helianthus annuus TaxID=4232 RepID=A0A251VBG3_HELAN|nr:putative sister chromatid cohesion protein Pds5 [Helianthus annuus]KAJ0944992.1 putative sister chromatid cohesion protein Pds5 [Helianthus annuus]
MIIWSFLLYNHPCSGNTCLSPVNYIQISRVWRMRSSKMASADVKLEDYVDQLLPVLHNMDVSAPNSATTEANLTDIPVTSAKWKLSKPKYNNKVSDTMKYDESLVGTKIKVWWDLDQMYYEGVVAEFYHAQKKHKVSYVDGDEETLDLRTEKWGILKEFCVRNDDEEPNTEVHSEEGFPDIHKKKKSKTDPAVSQEKIKDSAKKVADVSSSGGSKGSTPKDNQSTLKTSSKTKKVNKSKGKTPPSSSEFNTSGPTKAEKMEYDKEKDGRKLCLEDRRLRLEAKKLRFKVDKAQSKIRQEDERLKLEAEKMKLLKKESDILIMRMDTSVMPKMQRLYFEELQKEITTRGDHA